MKGKIIFTSLLTIAITLMSSSCAKDAVRSHEELKGAKTLEVEQDSFNLGWEGGTVNVSWKANCLWGLEFLAWGTKVTEEGDTTLTLSTAKWMSTPMIYGSGDGQASVMIDANSRSRSSREGYIKVFTGDRNVCKLINVKQAGNPDYIGPVTQDPIDLSFDFTGEATSSWPTVEDSKGNVVYTLDGKDYTFIFGRCNMREYLVVHNKGSYLGLPAIEDYRLTRVTARISYNNALKRAAKITADTEGTVIVGDEQEWPASPDLNIVYDLHDTEYNKVYFLFCTVSGLPVAGLTLHYEP